ncbi:hypothetical protein [Brevibacillus laterosporus]|uniref:Uncharacterized protein n=1 Tax=Brevibacillus laterosporus TaxID=1465 RepID=A0AAP3DEQ1_BRELA|nr:hypothetical protein [Brevibacillus laterosporus]MCR8979345.1 hypothetical protein [Brevibacillus laterosporus]MCZ0806501.1 hypothetical protein [Brevibacillus laterosporus]MCZ0824764.1 hypothetical protein [Brevibacillus laterosporus]MCZ0848669.1 hypothetical protein [Brevibacillus laterosporus]
MKQNQDKYHQVKLLLLLTQERGLKPLKAPKVSVGFRIAPYTGAWIETKSS